MQHIVERILDGLPVYLKEDYPKFVALLRAYYTWQSQDGKLLEGMYGHEARIDVDRDGLARVITEMDELDVPVEHRRTFTMFSQAFNSSRGSLASFDNFFRIFYDAPVQISNSSRYVFMPSSAVRERYHRAIISSSTPLPSSGVLRQAFAGGVADIVAANCIAVRDEWTYEIITVLRNDRFYPGPAALSYGEDVYVVNFVPFAEFTATAGSTYAVGDDVAVTTDLMTFIGKVGSLLPVSVESVDVVTPGTGYSLGNVITIVGARGFRAEVSAVGLLGEIVQVRVVDSGDPFGGVPSFFIASKGQGATLAFNGLSGRPLRLDFDLRPFGVVTGVQVTSDTGVAAAFASTPLLFHETWIPRGYNGVIGVGTVLTDSAAYQDASYIVSTPVDASKWLGKVKKLLHPAGRYLHAVKTAGSSASLPGIVDATSTAIAFASIGTTAMQGEGLAIDTIITFPQPQDLSLLLDDGQAADIASFTTFPQPINLSLDFEDGQTSEYTVT